MSFLANLAGGLLGNALGGAISSAQSANLAEKQAEIQYKNWEKMQSNKHQLEVKDLEAAGLNKILSATNGSAVSAPAISMPNVDSKLGTTAMQLSIEQQKAEIAKTEAETNKMNAETARTVGEAGAHLDTVQAGNIEAKQPFEISNLQKEGQLLEGQSALVSAQTQRELNSIINDNKITEAQVRNLDANSAVAYKTIDQITANIDKINNEIITDVAARQKLSLETDKLNRELRNLEPQHRQAYLESWIGEHMTYLGYFGQDAKKLLPDFIFGSLKR